MTGLLRLEAEGLAVGVVGRLGLPLRLVQGRLLGPQPVIGRAAL